MSNILFALYHDFSANSAVHVHNFANELATRGFGVAVAIPNDSDRGHSLGQQNYTVFSFAEADGDWSRIFADEQPPAIVHAWTPRENVRLFCEKVAGFCDFHQFIHLEDNEELILEVNLAMPFAKLAHSSIEIPANLSHPKNYRSFIAAAAGVTIIMDRLEKFVPESVPRLVLWPGGDGKSFYPRARNEDLLESLGISRGTTVMCYTGNVHSANARDVRSLYLAAAILNREGTPTVLLRTGRDFCSFLGPHEEWARKISIDLGHVDYASIPEILSLADVLVQPGADDAFNEFRLPGKLPEFFAMGLPLIIPETNLGRFARHGEDAWVLPKVDALGIVDAIRKLRAEPVLADRLAKGALAFSAEHFDWKKNTDALVDFYQRTTPGLKISATSYADSLSG